MNYIDKLHPEIRNYINILCANEFPDFILKYINTKELKRLSKIGLFCGMYYTNIPVLQMKHFYSRLDHSIACACITWILTKDKTQTICALFHDLGTPAFSHANDFKLGDGLNQLSSEKKVKYIIEKSDLIKKHLKEDGINIDDVIDPKKYPIIDKDIPALCVDRLEGILSTSLIWGQYVTLEDIKRIYNTICIFDSDVRGWFLPASDRAMDFGIEVGIDEYYAEEFYEMCVKYSILLQTMEDKFAMKFLGDILKAVEKNNIVKPEEFYTLSEEEIVNKIINSKYKVLWDDFTKLSQIEKVTEANPDEYSMEVLSKVRFCSPLVGTPYGPDELDWISGDAQDELLKFITFFRENNNVVMNGVELSTESKKLLKQI